MTDDPSGRLIALRDQLQAIVERKRASAARITIPLSGPERGSYLMCRNSILAEADELDGLITALLRPQREAEEEDTKTKNDPRNRPTSDV